MSIAGAISGLVLICLCAAMVIVLGALLYTPKRFSTRGLLILMTYIAFVIGIASVLYRMKNN
jgi:hypothetical protein